MFLSLFTDRPIVPSSTNTLIQSSVMITSILRLQSLLVISKSSDPTREYQIFPTTPNLSDQSSYR